MQPVTDLATVRRARRPGSAGRLRVLFVPCIFGVVSHGVPLVALNRRLSPEDTESQFLVPEKYHALFQHLGVRTVPIDHHDLRTELAAYGRFRPDVVVDDLSLSTLYASRLARIPRITIARTGSFAGEPPTRAGMEHSLRMDFPTLPDVTFLGLEQPRCHADMTTANARIIPSIPSIEVPPELPGAAPCYTYAGPLILPDRLLLSRGHLDRGDTEGIAVNPEGHNRFADLESFLARIGERELVYVTLGNVAVQSEFAGVCECIRSLLDDGIAVATNVPLTPPAPAGHFFHASYMPMHTVCQHADVVVHHCGSGTYFYPLIHGKPAVTVGTGCYDREAVAAKLQTLGVSTHVARDTSHFAARLRESIETALHQVPASFAAALQPLQAEIKQVSTGFDFAALLRQVVSAARIARSSPTVTP